MELELLREADMTLNACGRPTPPPGYRFVDLPYALPFSFTATTTTPSQARIANIRDTVFLIRGISSKAGCPMRIRWPDGTFFNQLPSTNFGDDAFPFGFGPNMLSFPNERAIDPGEHISFEFTTAGASKSAIVKTSFFGVLRYLMRETNGGGVDRGGASCIVGYPSTGKRAMKQGTFLMLPDPIAAYKAMPRLLCTPNQNIMAPEVLLGNQFAAETPEGWEDESFTTQSAPIAIPSGTVVDNNVVIVPGADDFVIRNLLFDVTQVGDGFSAIPTFALRLPNGYAVTGGDMVPITATLLPGLQLPMFTTLRISAGGRLIFDLADMLVVGGGTTTVVITIDGVKRRKKRAA